MQKEKDIVCAMDVNVTTPYSKYKGKIYFFCCTSCKFRFDQDQKKFVEK